MQIPVLHGPGAKRGAPARGRGRGPRPAPRAHLGSVLSLSAECATEVAATLAVAAAAAAEGRRWETLASPGARLGQQRGTWGGAGFGPAWGRMVNLEPMHAGKGRKE